MPFSSTKIPSLEKRREYTRHWRERNPDKVKAQQEQYRKRHRKELAGKQREYYKRKPEKVKAYNRQWAKENPEKLYIMQQRTRENNRDSIRESSKRWTKANPESVREKQRRRRARLQKAVAIPFTTSQLEHRLSMFGNRCWVCGDDGDSVDHVKPLAKGGTHCLSNMRPICTLCNSRKRDRWPLVKSS